MVRYITYDFLPLARGKCYVDATSLFELIEKIGST